MNTILKNFVWLGSWEVNKKHNVEVGFDNHVLLKGYISEDIFSDLEQLPDRDVFLEISKLKPKRYGDYEILYGEILCYVKDKQYRVIYYYDKGRYMITDDTDAIIKMIEYN